MKRHNEYGKIKINGQQQSLPIPIGDIIAKMIMYEE
jgi:hypothetical protein